MPQDVIRIVNARQHNLKGVTVDLPRRALIVVTGPSGSGKSSLAFDTVYAEGQRRFVESLSTYAKQFLDRMPKPLVDRLEGIPPAVAIRQHNPAVSSRSTVGTATEVYDYLRLLWARAGTTYCRACGGAVRQDTPQSAAEMVEALGPGRLQVCFPLPASARHRHDAIVENLRALGFLRLLAGGEPLHLEELAAGVDLTAVPELLVVVDRLVAGGGPNRLVEAITTAFQEGEGIAVVVHDAGRLRFTEHPTCSKCDTPARAPTPALFSFNNPQGACATCNGFGAVLEYDESLIVPDPTLALSDGAIDPWTKPRYEARRRLLLDTAKRLGIDPNRPWARLKAADRALLLTGKSGRFVGIIPFLRGLEPKRYKQYIRVFLRQYQLALTCPDCAGTRLNAHALAVRLGSETIADVSARPVGQLRAWLAGLVLSPERQTVAQLVIEQLEARLRYLDDVGLGYLALDRQARTLSGGEAQRIALANALGSRLVDSLYVLDEPSIGLHPRDTDRLLALLRRLRDLGNTVLVVEHDPAAVRQADFMLELGPGAGERGGSVMHAGPPETATATLTGQYLSGAKCIAVPSARRPAGPLWLRVRGATLHNLRGVDANIPLGTLTAVTGVSGSGKSSLVHDVLYRELERRLHGGHSAKSHLGERVGTVAELTGAELVSDVLLVDQSPIGRTPRSNPSHLREGVRRHPGALRGAAARPGPRIHRVHLLVQPAGRPVRGLRGRRARPGGDGLPRRRLRAVRDLRREPVQAGTARHQDSRRVDPRRAAVDRRRGHRAIPPPAKARHRALAPAAGRARLPPPRPAGHDPLRRRGAAAQDRARTRRREAEGRTQALHPGRADHRAPPRRRPGPARRCSTSWWTPATPSWSSSTTST